MQLSKTFLPLVVISLFVLSVGKTHAQSSGHSFGVTPEISTKILLTDSLGAHLSLEAKRIIGRPMSPIPDYYTRRDTTFSASLFAPLAFDLNNIPSIRLQTKEIRTAGALSNPFTQKTMAEKLAQAEQERLANNKVAKVISFANIATSAREYVLITHPRLINRTSDQFPERVKLEQINVEYGGELAQREVPQVPVQPAPALGESIQRKYWIQSFNGSLHLSQSSVSKNWHKGGYNTFNVSGRVYYNISYKKDNINWINEFEYKMGLFANNVEAGESKKGVGLKISEDILRINSNFGIKARERWFYTLDAQLKSQLMQNKDSDGEITTRTFAPLHLAAGLGMKYELELKAMNGDPFQKLKFTANVAPVSATLVYTYSDLIDKGRIGLQEDEKYKLRFGSTIHLTLNWDFNDRINWRSRILYNTSYKHVETEFENAFTFAFSRFFSARVALDLRFDDSVILDEPKTFKNLLQYNQLISLGFEYKF